eukprot:5363238-Pyramimonas_sp.AAC.1
MAKSVATLHVGYKVGVARDGPAADECEWEPRRVTTGGAVAGLCAVLGQRPGGSGDPPPGSRTEVRWRRPACPSRHHPQVTGAKGSRGGEEAEGRGAPPVRSPRRGGGGRGVPP